MRKSIQMAIVPIGSLLVVACGSSGSGTTVHHKSAPPPTSSTSVTVSAKAIKPYGTVLVNSSGHALYVFAPDKAAKVTCVSGCAQVWPPLALPGGSKPAAGSGVKASLLGSDPNPSGGRVVTYNGWPLYTYVTDTAAGVAHGQGINSSGGLWYLMAPSGTVVKGKGGSSSSSSSYPYG